LVKQAAGVGEQVGLGVVRDQGGQTHRRADGA
jgi:hypothetical protein